MLRHIGRHAGADCPRSILYVHLGSGFAFAALGLLLGMASLHSASKSCCNGLRSPAASGSDDGSRAIDSLEAAEHELRGRIEVLQELESKMRAASAQQVVAMYERLHEKLLEPFGLTEMERKVALATITGDSNAAIAERLHISENSVKHHLSSVFKKTGTDSRQDLHAQAIRALRAIAKGGRPDQSSDMMR